MMKFTAMFATVQKIEDKGNFFRLRLTTTDKDAKGETEYSNWFVSLVGKGAEKARTEGLTEKDVITIIDGKHTRVYNKEKNTNYENLTAFDYELVPATAPTTA